MAWAVWEAGWEFWPLVSRVFTFAVLGFLVALAYAHLEHGRPIVDDRGVRRTAWSASLLLGLGIVATAVSAFSPKGLIAPQGRADNDYRLYSAADVHALRFIRLCRAMDMSLDEVRTLLALNLGSPADCGTARAALDAHLDHVRERLRELRALEKDLAALRDSCDGQGAH